MARISDRYEDIVMEAVSRWDGYPPTKLDVPGAGSGTVDIWRTETSGRTTAIEVTSATDETHAANSALPDSIQNGTDSRLASFWMLVVEGQRVSVRDLKARLVDALLEIEKAGPVRDARGFILDVRLQALGIASAVCFPPPDGSQGGWSIGLVSGGVGSAANFSAVVQSALDRPDNAKKLLTVAVGGKAPDERWLWIFIGAGHFGQERNLVNGFTDGLPMVQLPTGVDVVVVSSRSSSAALKYDVAGGWEVLDVGEPDIEHVIVTREFSDGGPRPV